MLQGSDYNLDPGNISTNTLNNRAHINHTSHQPNTQKIKKSMKLALINCRSVVNKQSELDALLYLQNLDILLGTESYLDDTIMSSEVFPSRYTTYRHDRNRHGGGVFILVRSDIPSSQIHVSESIEQIWVHVHKQHKQSIILGAVYCPPNSLIEVLDRLHDTISDIRNSYPTAKLFLGGDFNSPGIY